MRSVNHSGSRRPLSDTTLNYTLDRRQFGRQIAGFQLVQSKLADMACNISTMRMITLRSSRLLEQSQLSGEAASAVKRDCCRIARRICADGTDLLGGNGIMLDYDVPRQFNDVESLFTYEGTDHVQTLLIGRAITGISALK